VDEEGAPLTRKESLWKMVHRDDPTLFVCPVSICCPRRKEIPMLELLQKLAGNGSMEARFLLAILFLDLTESLANELMAENHCSPDVVLTVAQTKQAVIDEFARNNQAYTLASIQQSVEHVRSQA
jgi:hypothetical protein